MTVSNADFQVRTHRSLVDVAYRLLDAAAILAAALFSTRYTDNEHIENLAVVGATTLIVHMVAIEVSGLYRSWRGSRLSLELWCVLLNWIYTAPAVLGIGLLTRFNAEFSYNTKVAWLIATPLLIGSGRVVLRMALKSLRRRGFNTRRFAICGVNQLGLQLAQNIQASPELGLELAGFFDDRPATRNKVVDEKECPRAGTLNKLVGMARSGEVDMVFIVSAHHHH